MERKKPDNLTRTQKLCPQFVAPIPIYLEDSENSREKMTEDLESYRRKVRDWNKAFTSLKPVRLPTLPSTIASDFPAITSQADNLPKIRLYHQSERRQSVASQTTTVSNDTSQGQAAMVNMFAQMMTKLTQCVEQQQQFMRSQQEAMQHQQQVFQQWAESMIRDNCQSSTSQAAEGSSSLSPSEVLVSRPNNDPIHPTGLNPASQEAVAQPILLTAASSNAVSSLASQIPVFGGTEQENVNLWIQRINQVALIHNATDKVVLLAASTKLTKDARKWYDTQSGLTLQSWQCLSSELSKMFSKRIPFHLAMQQAEARKWIHTKESFDQYATVKLALLYRFNLPEADVIDLLIRGITISSLSLCATSLAISVTTLDQFLTKMRVVTKDVNRKM